MNVINVIQPYWHFDMWVFDDPRVGLSAEPFVDDAGALIDRAVSHIPEARSGFIMIFSSKPFPSHQFRLEWQREDGSGNVYHSKDFDAEGWLCPALLRYFDERPSEIYVQVKPKTAVN